ncbi:CocE/NonD family hydrolase C-terminal non-catalytic domain-containing protein [Gilliamella apicola]|uniref:CocE/NonD family hydrolase C-terminal non-catalytic domain-containing protein n=1 Tax=Gilliamella apicola TaxID=1196095 RepID=UPI00080E40F5|nr:CocE/NonD family hydrolase C-terminal non-catalytic domain-containing protein [Gilliamella apicola]OCG12431.1 hypothetical protein A9G14_00185 [Gilliamella apicola]
MTKSKQSPTIHLTDVDTTESISRRRFLSAMGIAGGALAASQFGLPFIGKPINSAFAASSKNEVPFSEKLPLRIYGNDAYPTYFRRPLPLDAPRVRYPGFKPGSEILCKGTIRRKGAMPLPCDIMFERDIAITLRDRTASYLRVSRRALDPALSTEIDPVLLLQGEQRLSPKEVVPVDIGIWPLAMKFHPGEQLKLTIEPFRNDPVNLPFGQAAIDLPKNSFTFEPGTEPEMIHLAGGGPATMPAWAKSQEVMPPSRNKGVHHSHFGAECDSYLLVPLKKL